MVNNFVDLTQTDSDSEEQAQKTLALFLGHRTVSSSIPQKRKSDRDSETTSLSSFTSASLQQNGHIPANKNILFSKIKSHSYIPNPIKSQPYTPSPAPETPEDFSVVVPSPSAQLKREFDSADIVPDAELTGVSERYYPIDAHERRASKGAYPTAKKADRFAIQLTVGVPGPLLTQMGRRPVQEILYQSLERKLASIKGPAVTVARGDEQLLARTISDFEFINEYKLRQGVQAIEKEFIAGCSCDVICDPARCGCLTRELDSNHRIIPYKRASDAQQSMVLSPDFMSRISMIYECNSLCGCTKKCWNRVVGYGRTIRFEIFDTKSRGFGLRSPDFIRAGQFIDLYLGEVITNRKADEREKIANSRNAPSYLFSLDFLVNDDDIYVVDGCNFGAATRFINHSCNPNCRMFTVSRTHGDNYLYDLAFFALQEIPPGTELTFDYNPGMERVDKPDPNAVPCLCGEENCRGQLWANERKKTK